MRNTCTIYVNKFETNVVKMKIQPVPLKRTTEFSWHRRRRRQRCVTDAR